MNSTLDPGGNPLDPVKTPPGFRLQRLVAAAILGYAIALGCLFLAMEFLGERSWPLAILLYLPQVVFLLPLIVLVPAALLAEVPTRIHGLLGCCLIMFLLHVPFYPGIGRGSAPEKMKLITNNYATSHGLPLQPFIDAEDPDFVAVEDAAGKGPAFQHSNPGRTVRATGQFIIVSKWPVKTAATLDWPRWRGQPVAAVFDMAWHGGDLAIYAVHLPTPRGDFAKLAGLGLLKELAGRNRRRSDDMSFGEAMTARVQLARDLSAVLAREARPFVAAGDFNMPSDGYVHRELSSGLTDCFARTGRGFGFTFPCDTHDPLTLGGPWLRLDYILAGPGWRTLDCRVEPGRRSKHRAVVATLVWNGATLN
jgi:endonuclease/exonuclease/phosphatase family metal-dependent hydrolase